MQRVVILARASGLELATILSEELGDGITSP